MKATLLSYLAGMGGDFLAFQIHHNSNYFPITQDLIHNSVKITKQNMWRFPNLLAPIGIEAKIYPHDKPWAVNEESLTVLNQIYGDKNILLPSHWYRDIDSDNTNKLFETGIRLYAGNKKSLKVSYALWWIKSHVVANEIWPHRWQEIEEYKLSNRPNKHLLPQVIENYHNWKYMSMRFNLLNDGQFDLRYYVEAYFNKIYVLNNQVKFIKNYSIYDINKIFYANSDHLDLLEKNLNVTVNRLQIKEYVLTNYQLIRDCLGIDVDSEEFENDNTYYNAIIKYAKIIINQQSNQFDYYASNNKIS